MKNILKEIESKMGKTIDVLSDQYMGIRLTLGVGLIESIKVPYHGSPTPIVQLAHINMPFGNRININPYDPDSSRDIERGIHEANLGLGIMKAGTSIVLSVPMVSMEMRNKMADRVKKLGEDAKIAIRNIRRDAKKAFDKMSEDETKSGIKEVQEITDDRISKIQAMVDKKVKQLLM